MYSEETSWLYSLKVRGHISNKFLHWEHFAGVPMRF